MEVDDKIDKALWDALRDSTVLISRGRMAETKPMLNYPRNPDSDARTALLRHDLHKLVLGLRIRGKG